MYSFHAVAFKVCGILDKDYMDDKSYAGDGDEVSVEVDERGLIVVDKGCIQGSKNEYSESYTCFWDMEYSNGSAFRCGHLIPPQPYEKMQLADGSNSSALFEIIWEDVGQVNTRAFLTSSKSGNTIHRSDTWTLCGAGHACGCCKNPNHPQAQDKNGLCINIGVTKGEAKKVSIGVNQKHFTYEGDGDPITVTYI